MKRFVVLLLALLMILSGCSTAATTATATTATTTTLPTKAATTTTATTAAKTIFTAEQIVQKLKAAGMPVNNIIVFTEATDRNNLLGRPSQYTSKASFSDPAHKDNNSAFPDNTIEVFSLPSEANARAEYTKSVSAAMPALAQYIYLEGVYVLRIDHEILPSDAIKYESAFLSAVK